MQIKFFKKKEKEFKKESSSLSLNLYWELAVCFALIAVVLSLVFGYFHFIQINKEQVVTPAKGSGQFETIKVERISKVLEFFSERAKKSDQILNFSSTVVDPSL